MLSYLRKHSKTWFTRLIFGMIIFVFVLWGGSSYMAREANMLAKVDRHIITIEQFEKNYQKAYDALQERFGGSLSPEMLKAFNLKQAVLDDMIDEYVVDQEAARAKRLQHGSVDDAFGLVGGGTQHQRIGLAGQLYQIGHKVVGHVVHGAQVGVADGAAKRRRPHRVGGKRPPEPGRCLHLA